MPETFMTKAFFLLASGDIRQSSYYLGHFEHANYHHPLVDLIKALLEFNKGNCQEALKSLKQVLWQNPRCPPAIRFGIGLCYYRMGHMDKARFAFQRVCEIDEDNVMGRVGLAIVEMQIQDSEMRSRVAQLIEQAY